MNTPTRKSAARIAGERIADDYLARRDGAGRITPTATGLGPDTYHSTDNLHEKTGVTIFPMPGNSGARLLIAHVEGTAVAQLIAHGDDEETPALEYLHGRVADHECALVCGYEFGSGASA